MEIRLDGALTALARWPLSRARLVGSLPGGARNVNLLVEDAGGSRYVLRCCRRNPSRDRIRFQLDFQDHLGCRGIPTAEVVVTATGGRWVATDAASLWVLFRFVEGNACRYDSRPSSRTRRDAWRTFTARPPTIACVSGRAPIRPRYCARTWHGCALSARASQPEPGRKRKGRPGRR